MTKTNLNDYFKKHMKPLPEGFNSYRDFYNSVVPQVECKDGFTVSVQAGKYHYCSPRSFIGPWSEVEVGFPSQTPELIMDYCESPDDPTGTVYGYVPIELVEQLIDLHGGIADYGN